MKKALILMTLILVVGGWTANKFLQRSNKSSEVEERFIDKSSNYNHEAEMFLTEQAKKHHEEAFTASYRMWKFSPISEFDLSTHYDEKMYYRTLGKLISEEAKKQGQTDAYAALLDIGPSYGVPMEKHTTPIDTRAPGKSPSTPPAAGESGLKKPKLGDKRAVPGRRDRNDD